MVHFKQAVAKRLQWLAFAACFALVLGQLGRWHYFLEWFSHFLPYYALVWALAAAWVRGKWRIVWVLFLLGSVWVLFRPVPAAKPHNLERAPAVLWYNVHLDNPDAAAESERILALNPEMLALAEIHADESAWQKLYQAYPHGCEHRDHSPFALAVRSRLPLIACEVVFVDDIPYIRAMRSDGVAVFALHPPPPVSRDLAETRQRYLHTVAQKMALEKKVLAVGDLNSSPFSPVFRDFTAAADVAAYTPAYLPTWKPFALNIDHALARAVPLRVQAQPWLASDHRPLAVWF